MPQVKETVSSRDGEDRRSSRRKSSSERRHRRSSERSRERRNGSKERSDAKPPAPATPQPTLPQVSTGLHLCNLENVIEQDIKKKMARL